MFKLAKPRGFINYGKNLYVKPDILKLKADVPASILFISDIHLRESHPEILDRVLEAVNGIRPGMIMLGGDLAEYPEGFEIAVAELRRVLPDAPMFLVPGNNDNRACDGDRGEQRKLLAKYNCTYLLNESVRCGGFEIAGVEDHYDHIPCAKGLFSDEKGLCRVLLAHAPHSYLLEETEGRADLMLSGHTHGGQINVLGFTCYFGIYEKQFNFTHIAGVKRIGKTLCVVSRGIGISKYPLRVCSAPDIYLIDRK